MMLLYMVVYGHLAVTWTSEVCQALPWLHQLANHILHMINCMIVDQELCNAEFRG